MKINSKGLKIILLVLIIFILFFVLLIRSYKEKNILKTNGILMNEFENLNSWEIYDYERSYLGKKGNDILISDDGYKGKAVLISGDSLNDARIYKKINVEPNSYYKLSVMVKAKTSNQGKGASISAMYYAESYDIKDTSAEWEEHVIYIKTNENQNKIYISLGLGGYSNLSKGYVYYDEFELEKVDEVPKDGKVIIFSNNLYNYSMEEIDKNEKVLLIKFIFLIIVSMMFLFTIIINNKFENKNLK